MNKITWTNGVTKLNKTTMDTFQNNIETAIDEVNTKVNSQIVQFDFTTINGVTKNSAGVNKGYYNKLTKQVSVYFVCELPKALGSDNLAFISLPSAYTPSKLMFFAGLMVGVGLAQFGVTSAGRIEAYSPGSSATQVRGYVSYFID